MDAFLNNKSCFLAEDRWKEVLLSAICNEESFTEQRDLILGLWGHLVDGPKWFKEVTDLIVPPTSPPPQTEIDDLIEKLLKNRNNLLGWASIAQTQFSSSNGESKIYNQATEVAWPILQSNKCSSQHIAQLALWGTYVLCRILKDRLLVALSPVRFQFLETESQDLAGRILGLRQTITKDDSEQLRDHLFVSQSIWIAKGVVGTKDIWCERQEARDGIIEKWRFEAWCKAIGRAL
jgi:hypothetical protein